MISKDEVLKIAKLARLELTEKEIEKMQKDLSVILDYFNVLKSAPESVKILPEQNFGGRNKSLRKDEPKASNIEEEIIKAFPDKKDNYIKVKSIL